MAKKQNKFRYLKVIQQYVKDYGWCDYTAYNKNDPEQMESLRQDLRDYRINEPAPYRVISRRIPANEQFHA